METQQQKQFKVLLLGDVCVDTTVHVKNTRNNPENEAPLYDIVKTTRKGGMSINVESCLRALGISVMRISSSYNCIPPSKTRLVYEGTGNYICRIDEDCTQEEITLYMLPKDLEEFDAIVISDYNKGSITPNLVEYLTGVFKGPILVDTKYTDLGIYYGCTVKINEVESFLADFIPRGTIITMGKRGARIQGSHPIPAPEVLVVDVCGAGDAFLAGLTYGKLKGLNAMHCGIVNASISVQYAGTYSPTETELKIGLGEYVF